MITETAGHSVIDVVKKQRSDPDRLIKRGVWAYFFLVLFEGALRKWVLPGLSTPLLVIRDPLALWIIYEVWQRGNFPSSGYIKWTVLIGTTGIFTAMFFGHGSLPVAIFGARILLIHFPFMFAIGKILDRDDVIEMGKRLIWISIPMVLLIALQFYSPQSALVNKGIGDGVGSGFSGAMGFFRPSATFSFTNGTTLFFSLVACYVIYFWLNPGYVNKIILIFASAAVMMSIPLSISRTLLFSIGISVLFAVIGAARDVKYTGKMILAGLALAFCLMLLNQLTYFQTATQAFTSRFETANEQEGGLESVLGDRYLGGLIGALQSSVRQPFFGYGIGMGTSVGSQLLTGKITYLIKEGEWGRLVGELGPVLGLGIIFIRVSLSLKFLRFGYRKLSGGDLLPWMLLSYGLLIIPQGQWAQPTSLGFSTLIGGILIASIKKSEFTSSKGFKYGPVNNNAL